MIFESIALNCLRLFLWINHYTWHNFKGAVCFDIYNRLQRFFSKQLGE